MRTGVIARRISLRRKPKADPVTPGVREFVLERDRYCFAYRLEGPDHECRDAYGRFHPSTRREALTLDHVKDAARMGKRAPSDPAHLVAMCWDANVNGWASTHRVEERAYLAALEEPEHTHVEPVPGCTTCYQVFG